jgi:hypothetical protein
MARTLATPKRKRCGSVLLAIPPDCACSQTSVFDLAANLRQEPAILCHIHRRLRSVRGRVLLGMAMAEEEQRVRCASR